MACRRPEVRIPLAPPSSTVVMSQDIEDMLRRSSGPVRTRRSRGARRLRSSCARSACAPRAAGVPGRGCGIDRPQPQRWPSADGIPEPGQRLIRDDAAAAGAAPPRVDDRSHSLPAPADVVTLMDVVTRAFPAWPGVSRCGMAQAHLMPLPRARRLMIRLAGAVRLSCSHERVQPVSDDAPLAGLLTLHGRSFPRPCLRGLDSFARSEPPSTWRFR